MTITLTVYEMDLELFCWLCIDFSVKVPSLGVTQHLSMNQHENCFEPYLVLAN